KVPALERGPDLQRFVDVVLGEVVASPAVVDPAVVAGKVVAGGLGEIDAHLLLHRAAGAHQQDTERESGEPAPGRLARPHPRHRTKSWRRNSVTSGASFSRV